MCREPIPDEEIVCIRIPSGEPWFQADTISSANFKLNHRVNEQGISVYREAVVTHEEILSKPGAIAGSFLATARVGAIRSLCDGTGKPLGLDVIPVDDEKDPGHAEIRSPTPGQLPAAAAKALKKLFVRVEVS